MSTAKDTRRFWNEPRTKRHTSVVATAKQLARAMAPWLQNFSRYEKLYAGVTTEGQAGTGRLLAIAAGAAPKRKLPVVNYNVVKSIIDTKRAKITGTDIRPFAITNGGNWNQKRRAKKLTKMVDGLFYEAEMRVRGPEYYRHSRVLGTAAFKIFEENGRPAVELTDVHELRVDPEDGMHGRPRTLMQVKSIHRDVLREDYPKPVSPEAVSGANRSDDKKQSTTFADRVEVYEAWHLPSGPKAKDGVHVICTSAGTLYEEEWTEKDFPFVFLRADNRLFGFWGVGDAEDLEGLQDQVNKTNKTIQLSTHLCSVPRYWVSSDSDINEAKLNNQVGVIVKGRGMTPPQPLQAPQVPEDLYRTRSDDIARAYQIKGVNENAAGAQVPAGITGSGEAQRVWADTQTERFNVEAKEYEQTFIRVAKKLIQLARRISEREDGFSVKVPGRRFLDSIDWKDVDLEDDDFDLQILPTSNLPKTLSGRLAAVQELLQGGFISNAQFEGRRLLDLPDIEDDTNVTLATWDYADFCISQILDGKKRPPVDPYADLGVCVLLGRAHWLHAKVEGAPQKILDNLQRWVEEAAAKQKQMQSVAAPPAPGGPQPGPGMGRPGQPPTSGLMPVNQPPAAPAA